MSIVLADHRYGKAENRVVRFRRDTARHEIVDLNVTTTLRGDFADAYLSGDQSKVLPTDTQKNTVYAYAKEKGVATVEGYALDLARHFVDDVEPVSGARVDVEAYPWTRAQVGGNEHDHTWIRSGAEVRTAAATVSDGDGRQVVHVLAGLKDLTLLKSTGSQFKGFLTDAYTTLPETDDRVMATSLVATWRYGAAALADGFDFDAAYATIREALIEQFATLHSLALQQTLWHMGRSALERVPEAAEIRLLAPNKHHFDYDLARFGTDNHGEVFHAADRPYGLIQAVVANDVFPAAPEAWA
ncbi:factor-independent urate hydroxylase [Kineococcus radiotolerans]|uniref:Uricase n=1 Tax=Kineococcus radiotolerans (strain ATCC BAA-149 / DSM 14245 / SRS30216) TaxID=266940 RepID=A6W9R7_KINRD|nr:urate oxidase [Kineococcus radiotolerans]ABS03556.1 Urate oxidase [Kineococcus radiotolerans SRS30216 = ATCC BAA-149]